jgi:hypothetical protein
MEHRWSYLDFVTCVRETDRGRSLTDDLGRAWRTVALPDPPVLRPAHSSGLSERLLTDLRFSLQCWCRNKYCGDWLTVLDVSEQRTASKFKVSSPVKLPKYWLVTFPIFSKKSVVHWCRETLTSNNDLPSDSGDQRGRLLNILFVSTGIQGRQKSAVRRLRCVSYVKTASVHLWHKPFVRFSWNSVSLYKSLTGSRESSEFRWGYCHTSRTA